MAGSIVDEVRALLDAPGPEDQSALDAALDRVLSHFDCRVGTIHALDGGELHLRAARGLPDAMLPRIRRIPVGKGMAGLTVERRAPVQVCNLQTDASGNARPGARESQMEGSISFPLFVDGTLRGTMGIAKPTPYQFTTEETATLLALGDPIGRRL